MHTINEPDPYAYFKDVLERLPTPPASCIDNCCRSAGRQPSEVPRRPCACRQDDFAGRMLLTQLSSDKASRIVELLPHRWKPAGA